MCIRDRRISFVFLFCFYSSSIFSQSLSLPLRIEQIMQDPKWIGSSPSSPNWSVDGKTLYFKWNPDAAPADSLYAFSLADKKIRKLTLEAVSYTHLDVYKRQAILFKLRSVPAIFIMVGGKKHFSGMWWKSIYTSIYTGIKPG